MKDNNKLERLIKEVKVLRKDVDELRKLFLQEIRSKEDENNSYDYIDNSQVDQMDGDEKVSKFEYYMKKRGYTIKIYQVDKKLDKDTSEPRFNRGKYIGSRSTPLIYETIAKLIKSKIIFTKWEDYYCQIVKTVRDQDTGKKTQRKVFSVVLSLDPNDDFTEWD